MQMYIYTHNFINYPFTSTDVLMAAICIGTTNDFIGFNAIFISFKLIGNWFLTANHLNNTI